MLNHDLANANSSAKAVERTNESKSKGRRGYRAPVWKVLNTSKAKFNAQIYKDVKVKRACINASISKYYKDELRFWLDFKGQTELLLDSKRFTEYCVSRNLKPECVAEHVVFEDQATLNKVLKQGIAHVLGKR